MNHLLMKDDKGGNILVLVMGPANLNLMREGHPVSKRIEEFYPDGIPRKLEVLIYYSETPVHDATEFSKMAQNELRRTRSGQQTAAPSLPGVQINHRAVGCLEERISDGYSVLS